MITYKVLYKNYRRKKGEFMGVLVERRKDLRGRTLLESGLRWAKSMFGRTVKNKHWIFVVPRELNLEKNSYACGEDDIQQGGIWGKSLPEFLLATFGPIVVASGKANPPPGGNGRPWGSTRGIPHQLME